MSHLKVGAKVRVVEAANDTNWYIEGEVLELTHGRIVVRGYNYVRTRRPAITPDDWPTDTKEVGWGPWKTEIQVPRPRAFRKKPYEITVVVPENAFILILEDINPVPESTPKIPDPDQ